MTLEAQEPKLDTRQFEQIYNEARQRIPLYAPEWTDYNESDPGIALLQLYAWLTESMLYEMNRIPERNYIKFLQLLNMELRSAQPAVAHLTFTPRSGVSEPISISERTPIAAQPPTGGNLVIFETLSGLDVVRSELSQVQVYDGSAFTVVTPINLTTNQTFRPFGWQPGQGSALYLGFKVPDPNVSQNVFPSKISFRVFLPPAALAGKPQQVITDTQLPPISPVTLEWSYLPEGEQRWRKLTVYKDEIAGFTHEGYIDIEGPTKPVKAMTLEKVDEACYWLRCRLIAGTYPAGTVPEIAFIRANVVAAENLSTVREEEVGMSEGEPDQYFNLERAPVKPDSLVLELTAPNQDVVDKEWELKTDFLSSKPTDKHYTLDATAGVIKFGNGERGMIPVAGTRIVAQIYRYGGGEASNLPAGLIKMPLGPVNGVDSVINERASEGGRDQEKIEDLKREAPERIRSRNRAVTVDDYEALAKQAGGVLSAKAIALAHPQHPNVNVAGAVTIVIIPANEDMPPKPSGDLIKQVCKYLDGFRLLTTEVYVKGPEYRAISVKTTIEVQPYAAFDQVKRNVITALNDYLNPTKWEFGAELYPTSLYSVILQVKDVKAVTRLEILEDNQPHDNLTIPVKLDKDMLLYGTDHEIVTNPYKDI